MTVPDERRLDEWIADIAELARAAAARGQETLARARFELADYLAEVRDRNTG